MENLKRTLKYQYKDSKVSLFKFWIIILAVNIFIFIMNKISGPHSSTGLVVNSGTVGITLVSVAGVNLMALIVYLIVYNYENFYKGFPIAISFSVTRKDFALSLIAKTLFIIVISSIIQALLLLIDPIIVELAGKEIMHEYMIFNTKTDNVIYIAFALFILFLSFSSIWNLIASLNYRFGYKMWIVYFALYIMVISISPLRSIASNIWVFLGKMFIARIDGIQFLKLSFLIIFSQIIGYFNIVNTNIKHKA